MTGHDERNTHPSALAAGNGKNLLHDDDQAGFKKSWGIVSNELVDP
jgi:hypothetical protein